MEGEKAAKRKDSIRRRSGIYGNGADKLGCHPLRWPHKRLPETISVVFVNSSLEKVISGQTGACLQSVRTPKVDFILQSLSWSQIDR